MSKTRKLLSIFLAVIMTMSLLSGFCFTNAADSADVDKLIYSPFTTISSNPGYASTAPSGVTFISQDWANVQDQTWVYMDFNGEVYKAIYGLNAFSSINDALFYCGAENAKFKLGAGTYTEDVTLDYNGLKFYGNYAGVNPNVAGINEYTMNLNPERNPTLETVISDTHWVWTIKSNNITIDGVKITGLGANNKVLDIAISGQTSEYFHFYNNIVEDNTGLVFNANRGYSTGTYLKYNRFVNNTGTIFQGGGSMSDTVMDNNYFQDNSGMLYAFTSCGNNSDQETLVSFSYNIVNNCSQGVNFDYNNANFGANLDYKRVVGNLFYKTGSRSGYIIRGNYVLEYMMNATDESPTDCNDPGCKTFISENIFYSIPSGVSAVKLEGGGNLTGRTVNFVASVTNNKFLFNSASTLRVAVYSTLIGTLDASYNYFGTVASNGNVTIVHPDETTFNINEDTKLIFMPYYLDEDMTEISGGITLEKGAARVLRANGFDRNDFVVDNNNATITAAALDGYETVDFTNTVLGATFVLYEDFLLTKQVPDNKLNIKDTTTHAYLVATDSLTGMSVKYDVVVKSNTDRSKADFRFLIHDETNREFEGYSVNGTDITVNLDTKYIYFPFSVVVSPSATYEIYTDAAKTNKYDNPTGYIEPDEDVKLYLDIVSGDESNNKTYTITINRPGSNDYDARVISVISPAQDILIFNNERKSISYRPYAMIDSAVFDFKVSTNATYEIYKNYNPATGEVSELLSKQGDIKEIAIGDALSYFYVKVTSTFGYSQVYTLSVYNDVKSTDNVITGITGLANIKIENNVIYIEASTTVSAVNAHFETNEFADVVVYADADKQFKLTPAVNYEFINNREVEVRTFRLGISCQLSYFYVDVTSEVGETNSYKVIVTKGETSTPFIDIDNHWAEDYILEASRLGIVGGYYDADTDTYTFGPNKYATRQEVAAMFCRMMGIDPLSFNTEALGGIYADSDSIPEWSYNYIKAAYFLGIMTGSENAEGKREFRYSANITRQEFFQALSNLLKLDTAAAADCDLSSFKDAANISNWAIPATKAVVKAGVIEGADGYLNPKDNIKRSEIAKIVSIVNIISQDI